MNQFRKNQSKMTTISKIIATVIMSFIMVSCNFDMNLVAGEKGNGNVVSIERKFDQEFTAIHASEGLDVYLKQDGGNSAIVEADENLQEMIETEIKDGTLHIGVDGQISWAQSRKVYVSFGNIERIKSTSGSDVYSDGVIKATNLELVATSGSDMEVEVMADKLNCKTTSGSDMKLSGRVDRLEAEATSGSDLKAGELQARITNARASSGADLSLNTTEELVAKASSGGDIRYTGNPDKIDTKDSSSGSIRRN